MTEVKIIINPLIPQQVAEIQNNLQIIASKANAESIAIIAELAQKAKFNEKLKGNKGLLKAYL